MTRDSQEPMLFIYLAVGLYVTTTFWGIPLAEILVMGLLIERTITSVGKVQREVQKAAAVESAFWSVHQLVEEAGAEAEDMGGSRRPSLTRGCAFENVRFAFGERTVRSEEHTSELQSLMRISYAVFCLKKKNT